MYNNVNFVCRSNVVPKFITTLDNEKEKKISHMEFGLSYHSAANKFINSNPHITGTRHEYRGMPDQNLIIKAIYQHVLFSREFSKVIVYRVRRNIRGDVFICL